jgi:hypothetical protein
MAEQKWSLAQLGQAANIAARIANEGRSSNPLFTQALLEMARLFKEGKLRNVRGQVYLMIPIGDQPDFSRREESNHAR